MQEFLPFILPAIGLVWVIEGAWMLLAPFRRGRQAENGAATAAEASPGLRSVMLSRSGRPSLGGLFWLGAGLATVWFADDGILTGVGVFWIVVGAASIFVAVCRGKRNAAGGDAAAETAPATNMSPRAAIRGARWGGAACLCVGIATLWFSDVRIGASPDAAPEAGVADNPLAGLVTQQVQRAFEREGHIGLVVAAVSQDQEVLLGFGRRRLTDPRPPDAETVFEIGSITKAFTGILLARQIETGELELDDRILELLPEDWTLSEAARGITLRHCTTHTSGFPRLPANLLGVTSVPGMLFGGDPYRSYSEEAFRDALATVELEFEPGSERLYSNFAVGLLGHVLAARQGTDYETLVTEEICDPLGMDRTALTGTRWKPEDLAAGYRGTIKAGPLVVALESSPWQLPSHLAGAGGIRSTGGDMLRFLKANMGRLTTPLDSAIRRSHQELFQERTGRAMGMNWIRSFQTSIARNVLWHNGGTGGYRSYLGFTEDRRFGVVVLANTKNDVDDLAEEILTALVRISGDQKPITEHGYAKVAPFTGVRWEKDRPVVRVQDRWSPLVSIDGIPIERIVEFANEEFGNRARKRFAEDLVELLAKMGHDVDWYVTLELKTGAGQIERVKVLMTEENRDLVRQ